MVLSGSRTLCLQIHQLTNFSADIYNCQSCGENKTYLSLSTLPQGFVYWSDEMTHSVCRADKHNGRNLQVVLLNASSPGGVAIVHPVLQPAGTTS